MLRRSLIKGDRFDICLFIEHGKKDRQVRSLILDMNDNIYKDSDGDGKLDSMNIEHTKFERNENDWSVRSPDFLR